MYAKLTFAGIISSLALLALVPSGHADCCGSEYYFGKHYAVFRCADCSKVAWYYCAKGAGGCNIFGCNCDGGCLQPVEGRTCSFDCCGDRNDRKARDVDDFTPLPLAGNYTGNDVMNYVDNNQDGRLDEVEITIFVTRHGLPADAWRHLDVDGDDHLTAHEIDSDLKPLTIDMV